MSFNLFEPRSGEGAFQTASQWLLDFLQGEIVTALAVLAIALLGYEMLSGRLLPRNAARVILGCFILLGSSAIARGLIGAGLGSDEPPPAAVYTSSLHEAAPADPVPPNPRRTNANPFDPYSNTAHGR